MERIPFLGAGAVTDGRKGAPLERRGGPRCGAGPPRGEEGAVLAFVVLLLLAAVGLGHSALVLSLAEEEASRAAVRHLVARQAADGAVREALKKAPGPWRDSVAVGGARALPAVRLGRAQGAVLARRVAREAWLLEAEAGLPGRPRARAARLAWSLDPLVRVLELQGALTTRAGAPVALAGTVDVTAPTLSAPPLTPVDCASWTTQLELRHARSPLAPVAATIDSAGGPRLGLLDLDALVALATPASLLPGGEGTPAPLERAGVCVEDEPWAWGDPERPWRPCGAHLPLRASVGDLTVLGGSGQGTLVVDGDLVLRGGARYYGIAVAKGALRLEEHAALEGMALAWGGVSVTAGARVRASACWAVRALDAASGSLGRFVEAPGLGEVGPL